MSTAALDSLCAVNPETLGPNTPSDFQFRYLDISSVTKGRIDWLATRRLGFADAPSRARRGVTKGDVLLCTVRPGLQAHARIQTDGEPLVCSTGFAVLRPYEQSDSGFIFHQLFSHEVAAQLRALETGSNYPAVNERDVRGVRVYAPQAQERHRIAAVLDKVDEAIARTEAVIAKLRQVRAGMLHDLLTRGLDQDGQLRDPAARPEQFQDSPLGRIPREWAVETIEELLAPVPHAMRSGPFGSSLLKQELKSSGVPLLGIDNVHVERFAAAYTRFVGEDKFQELKQYSVRPLDIMITIMGTVGRCCVVPEDIGTALSSKHVWTITLNRERYSPHLACWQLNHAEWALRQLRVDEQGGVMTAIRSETLTRLRLPVPTVREKNLIEHILFRSTQSIEAEESELAKLHQLKYGLMTDLLTGRVRVSDGRRIT